MNLIRRGLQGDPARRPTVEQLLAHRLLGGSGAVLPVLRMCYAFFLSHAQADAAGVVADLYHAGSKFGLHAWLDMRQKVKALRPRLDADVSPSIILAWHN